MQLGVQLSWADSWPAVEAIATVLGAVATFVAVWVSLTLGRREIRLAESERRRAEDERRDAERRQHRAESDARVRQERSQAERVVPYYEHERERTVMVSVGGEPPATRHVPPKVHVENLSDMPIFEACAALLSPDASMPEDLESVAEIERRIDPGGSARFTVVPLLEVPDGWVHAVRFRDCAGRLWVRGVNGTIVSIGSVHFDAEEV